MKRLFALATALLISFSLVAPAAAQDATPVAPMKFVTAPGLGVSEFNLSITDDGFDAPESLPAGRYLVNVMNNASDFAAASFIKPSVDMTLEEMQAVADLSKPEDAGPETFAWVFDAKIAGGAAAAPGGLGQAVIILTPGHWFIWGDDPSSATPLSEITVTGAMPATMAELVAPVTITAVSTAVGYDFAVEGEIVAGQQLVKFINKTDQPHFVASVITPVMLDDEMFMTLFMSPEDATPSPDSGLPTQDEILDNPGGITAVSAGVTILSVVEFLPGFHTLTCFVPDPRNMGTPHSAEGMLEFIEVK